MIATLQKTSNGIKFPSIIVLLLLLACFNTLAQGNYVYEQGTIWHPEFYDIINENDPSAFQSVTYTGQQNAQMWDREANNHQGQWTTPLSWIFRLRYQDQITAEIRIRQRGFEYNQAAVLAKKYAYMMGQLPACLRAGVKDINIMKGDALFGGNNSMKSIDITIGKTSELYEKTGNLEETLVHEATHAALDYLYQTDYITHRNRDPQYISKYAYENPNREDISESFLLHLGLQYRKSRITPESQKIQRQIPNRLRYYQLMNLNVHPFSNKDQGNQELFEENAYYRLTTQWQGDHRALDIVNDGRNNQPILRNVADVSGQYWRIKKVGEDTYNLYTMWMGPERILRCIPGTDTSRPLLGLSIGSRSNDLWKITPIGNGYFRLVNQSRPDRSLDVINDGANDKIQLAKTGNYTGQYWKVTKIK
ncbi:MAG: hypothetical protein AAFO69_04575 [Bacteroidota bacterium]